MVLSSSTSRETHSERLPELKTRRDNGDAGGRSAVPPVETCVDAASPPKRARNLPKSRVPGSHDTRQALRQSSPIGHAVFQLRRAPASAGDLHAILRPQKSAVEATSLDFAEVEVRMLRMLEKLSRSMRSCWNCQAATPYMELLGKKTSVRYSEALDRLVDAKVTACVSKLEAIQNHFRAEWEEFAADLRRGAADARGVSQTLWKASSTAVASFESSPFWSGEVVQAAARGLADRGHRGPDDGINPESPAKMSIPTQASSESIAPRLDRFEAALEQVQESIQSVSNDAGACKIDCAEIRVLVDAAAANLAEEQGAVRSLVRESIEKATEEQHRSTQDDLASVEAQLRSFVSASMEPLERSVTLKCSQEELHLALQTARRETVEDVDQLCCRLKEFSDLIADHDAKNTHAVETIRATHQKLAHQVDALGAWKAKIEQQRLDVRIKGCEEIVGVVTDGGVEERLNESTKCLQKSLLSPLDRGYKPTSFGLDGQSRTGQLREKREESSPVPDELIVAIEDVRVLATSLMELVDRVALGEESADELSKRILLCEASIGELDCELKTLASRPPPLPPPTQEHPVVQRLMRRMASGSNAEQLAPHFSPSDFPAEPQRLRVWPP
mmetsp:Transcript_38924/g.82215  ORF Transcript_38924/g.82215 Transcript_38924/m.82215 type:complete len:617 (+) Transcript_38924:76-1926(+)